MRNARPVENSTDVKLHKWFQRILLLTSFFQVQDMEWILHAESICIDREWMIVQMWRTFQRCWIFQIPLEDKGTKIWQNHSLWMPHQGDRIINCSLTKALKQCAVAVHCSKKTREGDSSLNYYRFANDSNHIHKELTEHESRKMIAGSPHCILQHLAFYWTL